MLNKFDWFKFSLWILIGILAVGLVFIGLIHGHPHSSEQGKPPATGQSHAPSDGKQGGSTGKGGSTDQGKQDGSSGKGNTGSSTNKKPSHPKIAWGIDTTSKVNSSFHRCVVDHYGHPAFVGRYMYSNQGVYTGLSKSEVNDLHKQGIKILPIFDKFSQAKGNKHGSQIAQNAIKRAKQLGIPKGTYIFADIEKSKPTDSQFIIGWTKTLDKAGYEAGVYGNLASGKLSGAYKSASKQSSFVKSRLKLWTNQPIAGSKLEKQAPNHFKAQSVNLNQTILWQYSINGSKCNVDTDLIKGKSLKRLW